MKKKTILLVVLLLAVGFAAITTTLFINGTTNIGTNKEDFEVYYSKAKVNGVEDNTVITDDTHIVFTQEMKSVGETYVLDYDVTNGSRNYDAALTMTCTESNEYLSVTNVFDTDTNLPATETRTGKLTIELIKGYVGETTKEVTIECTISANAVERNALSEGTPADKVKTEYNVGDVVTIGTEGFHVIKDNEDTVTLFADYNLGTDYKQSTTANYVTFSNGSGWEYIRGPKEIDIQSYPGNAKTYVNNYVNYIKTEVNATETDILTGNLITVTELGELGCTIRADYSYVSGLTCANSANASWIVNGQGYWTRSTEPRSRDGVWDVHASGDLYVNFYSNYHDYGVRPVITISKSLI